MKRSRRQGMWASAALFPLLERSDRELQLQRGFALRVVVLFAPRVDLVAQGIRCRFAKRCTFWAGATSHGGAPVRGIVPLGGCLLITEAHTRRAVGKLRTKRFGDMEFV